MMTQRAAPAAKFGVTVGTRYKVTCLRRFHSDGTHCKTWQLCDRSHEVRDLWREEFDNLVVTTGRNLLLSMALKGTATGGASGGSHDGRRMPTKWVANTAYSVGDIVRPTNSSGQIDNNRIFVAEVAGTSHTTTEPTWPSSAGGSVTDSGVTWREMSVQFIGLKGAGTIAAADTMASHGGWSELTPYSQSTRPALVLGSVSSGSVDNTGSVAVFTINGSATIAGAFVCNLANKGTGTGTLYGAGDFSVARAVESGDTLNVTVTCSITSS